MTNIHALTILRKLQLGEKYILWQHMTHNVYVELEENPVAIVNLGAVMELVEMLIEDTLAGLLDARKILTELFGLESFNRDYCNYLQLNCGGQMQPPIENCTKLNIDLLGATEVVALTVDRAIRYMQHYNLRRYLSSLGPEIDLHPAQLSVRVHFILDDMQGSETVHAILHRISLTELVKVPMEQRRAEHCTRFDLARLGKQNHERLLGYIFANKSNLSQDVKLFLLQNTKLLLQAFSRDPNILAEIFPRLESWMLIGLIICCCNSIKALNRSTEAKQFDSILSFLYVIQTQYLATGIPLSRHADKYEVTNYLAHYISAMYILQNIASAQPEQASLTIIENILKSARALCCSLIPVAKHKIINNCGHTILGLCFRYKYFDLAILCLQNGASLASILPLNENERCQETYNFFRDLLKTGLLSESRMSALYTSLALPATIAIEIFPARIIPIRELEELIIAYLPKATSEEQIGKLSELLMYYLTDQSVEKRRLPEINRLMHEHPKRQELSQKLKFT